MPYLIHSVAMSLLVGDQNTKGLLLDLDPDEEQAASAVDDGVAEILPLTADTPIVVTVPPNCCGLYVKSVNPLEVDINGQTVNLVVTAGGAARLFMEATITSLRFNPSVTGTVLVAMWGKASS